MPKKIACDYDCNYYAFSRDCLKDFDKDIYEGYWYAYGKHFLQEDDGTKATEWLRSRITDLRIKTMESCFVGFFAFCKSYNPLPSSFTVFRVIPHYYPNIKVVDSIKVILDQSHSVEIRAAVDEDIPFEWPEWINTDIRNRYGNPIKERGYLFGYQFWTLNKQETFLGKPELRLLFLDTVDKERRNFERLKHKFSGVAGQPIENNREAIPEAVRIFVWRRDAGKCVQCGSVEKLEFDHIIPVSKGGSSTERNIQLLCEGCNRSKSNNV